MEVMLRPNDTEQTSFSGGAQLQQENNILSENISTIYFTQKINIKHFYIGFIIIS